MIMKNHCLNSTALLTSLLCLSAAPGLVEAADAKAPAMAEPQRNNSGGGFYLNGTLGFNISAKYSGFGVFPRQTLNGANGLPLSAGDRVYDDGYNLVEGLGAGDTRTFKWGFASDSQLNAARPATTAISFNSSTAAAVLGGSSVTGDPQPGFEMGYLHRLGELGKGSWGFMAGFGYLNVSLEDKRTYTGNVTRDTDTFATAPAVIPPAGYDGVAASPFGPRIENVPSGPRVTTLIAGGLTSTGPRSVNADLFALKLGPYYELPLCTKCSITLSGGLVLAAISSQFSFQEVNNIASINAFGAAATSQTFAGSNDKMALLPGGFADLRANYSLNDRWSVFAGGQYQYLSSFSQSASGRTAKLDFGKTLLVHFGASYSF